MKKIFTILLGGALAAGATAVALPAALSESRQAAAAAETPAITPDGPDYTKLKATWNPVEKGIDITYVAPTTGYYYDKDYSRIPVNLTELTKVEMYVMENYSTGTLINTWLNIKPGQTLTYLDKNVEPGQSYTYKFLAYVGEQSDYGQQLYGEAGSFPGDVTDIDVVTNKGSFPITISFVTPTKLKNSDYDLNCDIDRVELYSEEYDYSSWSNVRTTQGELLNVPAGSAQQFVIEGPLEEGTKTWYIQCTAADGAGTSTRVSFRVGADEPAQPANVTLAETPDKAITLTWDPVTKGANGGYVDPESITYKVYATEDARGYNLELIAEGITGTSYVYDKTYEKPTMLTMAVVAASGEKTSTQAKSSSIVVGPAAPLPFAETFDSRSSSSYCPDNLWTSAALKDGSYKYWSYGSYIYFGGEQILDSRQGGGMATVTYYSYDGADELLNLTSSKINVEGAGALELSFQYLGMFKEGETFTQGVEAQIAFDGGEFKTVKVADMTNVTATGWIKVTESIEVPSGSTTAVLRFQSFPGSSPEYVCIDDINLRESGAAPSIYPASASDLTATYDYENEKIVVSFKTPEKTHATLGDVNNEDLPFITRVDLLRQAGSYTDYAVIKSWDSPAKGTVLTYEDTDLSAGGNYYYKVIVYVGGNCDYGQFLDNPVRVGQIPAEIEDITLTTERGLAPVTIAFTTPSKDDTGADLRELKSVTIQRFSYDTYNWADIATLTDVKPATGYSYKDNDVKENEQYSYKVICNGTAGSNYGVSKSVYVGADIPNEPLNLQATLLEDGTVGLQWEAPTTGYNGGYVDVENLTYTVYMTKSSSIYDGVAIESGLTECHYVDATVYEEEAAIRYFVKAYNGEIEGRPAMTEPVFVGKPSKLPYVENFNTVVSEYTVDPNHIWSSVCEGGSSRWECAEMAYTMMDGQILPLDNDGGLMYAYFGPYGDECDSYLTSGNILVETAQQPIVRFNFYGIPGYNTELALEVSFDHGTFEQLWYTEYSQDVAEAGWVKVDVPVDVPEGAQTMSIRFAAHKGSNPCSAIVDNVAVFDIEAPELSAEGNNLAWTVKDNEFVELAGFHIYKNGERFNEEMLEPATRGHENLQDEGTYTVTALYNDGILETLHSNSVDVKLQSILDAATAGITVKAADCTIVVEGAEGLAVTVSTPDGRVVYNAAGDAAVSVVPGIYLVKVGEAPAVKLSVK